MVTRAMFGNLSRADRRLQIECQLAAAQSRDMWRDMRANGFGWTWEFYRGWLIDARDIRQGRKFTGHGSRGLALRSRGIDPCIN